MLDSPSTRAAEGRAARRRVPRGAHGEWAPAPERRSALEVLEEQEASRLPELLPLRHARMLASPFAFFRGAAAVMAADLAATPSSGAQVQLCGDAHIANFGGFASPERDLVFDINDFDETFRGPWEWDVKRLAASVEIAGRETGLRARRRADAVRASVRAYREAMRRFAAMGNLEVWYARLDASTIVAEIERRRGAKHGAAFRQRIERAQSRDHLRALSKLTVQTNGLPRIAHRPPLLVPVEELTDAGGVDVEQAMRALMRSYRESLRSDRRRLLDGFRYVHLARKVVGVGSVGTRAWVVLLVGRDAGDPLFLQVKEARRSVLEPYAERNGGRNEGRRVVQGQWLMQAASDILLGWLRARGPDGQERDFYVRQLWDWKASAEIGAMTGAQLTAYGELCAWTLARAHARSGDRVAIAAYLGGGDRFDRALAAFAAAYADQNERDHAALAEAARAGDLAVEELADA
jgi:uncharacterized protein (DUF2252 family)